MSRHPVVVKGCIWQGGQLTPGAIGMDPATGRITAVGRDLQGDVVHDHGDAWILPGAIDIHVHLRDPGHPQKEDFTTGTTSALVGGTTTVYDMPNTEPATTTVEAYEAKRAIARAKALCDWGLYGGATRPGSQLYRLAQRAPGIKLYLGESTGCVTLEDPDMLPGVLDTLDAAGFDGVLVLHAEAKTVLEEAGAAHRDEPGLTGHAARRPVAGEARAIEQVAAALRGRNPRYRVHVAHVSSPRLLDAVHRLGASFGVTPNHLFLHHDLPLGARGRMNPPLRTPHEQRDLFTALAHGTIPIVESDHAPHTAEEKARDVREAPSGIPGVATLRPLLLAAVAEGRLPLDVAVACTAERPARLFGLAKGRLEPGLHADIAVYDPRIVRPVTAATLRSRAGWTPFEGQRGVFPVQVFLRGALVVDGEAVLARPGQGREADGAGADAA